MVPQLPHIDFLQVRCEKNLKLNVNPGDVWYLAFEADPYTTEP
jgi:hypothetical protein